MVLMFSKFLQASYFIHNATFEAYYHLYEKEIQ